METTMTVMTMRNSVLALSGGPDFHWSQTWAPANVHAMCMRCIAVPHLSVSLPAAGPNILLSGAV